MIDRYDIQALQQQAEGQQFDRKSFRIEPKALAVIAVAFANADGSDIVLVEFMREYKLVKESGEGVDRMFREMAEAGNPAPEYKQVEFMVKVRLNSALRDENGTEQKDGQDDIREKVTRESGSDQKNDQKSAKWPEKTGEKSREKTVEKITRIIKENPTITIKELSLLLSLTRRGVEGQIKSLKAKGIIRRVGPDKAGHWEVLEQKGGE
ncbi:MAG: winged helix-turn-helix transcriptional regulator [Bacteroidales bacterium]|nr:winged helix-turn-helix transcriptional regulator [Bacteroidales bacterium]